eukprot:CAMPEP_0176095902 /NCGR_PEP_ID=MMETSP0120_2-20121206/48074_1 /TAXON_ID=160619 /ORGANISM="Kryptoperidinium foliaceum, Strain CCMP 1326" /LENGTH=417 /DNA_ID=CAMNT_0017429881 /DNA_START=28 /DNA_END=1278 /DNA_ORIENTATION=+
MAILRSWTLLLFASLVASSSVRESQAFSHRLVVPSRTLRPTPFSINQRYGRRRQDRVFREHKALSVPFSGPPADPKNAWADIMNPHISSETNHGDNITTVDKVVVAGAGVATAFFLYAVIFLAAPGAWRYFAAGGICAATSHAIPTPIDVVKTRKQVDPELMDVSFVAAASKIVKDDGMGALWAGLGPTAVGYLFEGAVKFGTYEILKPFFKRVLAGLASVTSLSFFKSQILSFVLCGAAAGVAASIMLCPMEAIRIRMVSEHEYADGGWLKAGYKILKSEGVEGLCKGMNPMVLKQVPYTVTKNVSFDVLTKSFYAILKAQGVALSAATMFVVPLLSAALASILSTVTSQPGDMVLSLVNAHKGDRKSSEIFRSILHSPRGIAGFFVGFKTRLLHVGVTVTIQLMVYDYVKRLCGI